MKSKRMKTRYSKRMKKRRTSKKMKKNRTKRMKKSRNKRKLKLFGGMEGAAAAATAPTPSSPFVVTAARPTTPGTPREFCGHDHTMYLCKDHFDTLMATRGGTCPFWIGIHKQLIDKGIDANAYDNQGTAEPRVWERMPCSGCLPGDLQSKDCAVFRNLRFCPEPSPCENTLSLEQMCNSCALCT